MSISMDLAAERAHEDAQAAVEAAAEGKTRVAQITVNQTYELDETSLRDIMVDTESALDDVARDYAHAIEAGELTPNTRHFVDGAVEFDTIWLRNTDKVRT